jgi:hypothetical protein
MCQAVLAVLLSIFVSGFFPAGSTNSDVKLTVLNSMERISPTDDLFGKPAAELSAARNEVESFQVVISPRNKNIKVINAELSDLTGQSGTILKNNFTLYREEYVRIRRSSAGARLPPGLYADPLVPFINPITQKPIEAVKMRNYTFSGYEMYALPFDVWKGQNQPIWVDVAVTKDTRAGQYKGSFKVTLDNNEVFEIPVTLNVWNFELPDLSTHRTHFGYLDDQGLERFFGVEKNSREFNEIELRYCRMIAKHRVNPPLPKSLMPEVNSDGSLNINPQRHKALKKFIEDLKVSDIEVPSFPGLSKNQTYPGHPEGESILKFISINREKIITYYKCFYKYLKQNNWDKRAYIYVADEPNAKEDYQYVSEMGKLLDTAAPGIKRFALEQPWPQDATWPNIESAINIWCPIISAIDGDEINKKLAKGDEVWSYTALAQKSTPDHPHYDSVKNYEPPYWIIDEPLAAYRVVTWINWQYKITGFQNWSTVYTAINVSLKPMENPWFNPGFPYWTYMNGDGFLLYPGTPCGMDGPIASLRMKNIREAMEDYEYMFLLNKLIGREKVSKFVSEVTTDWGHWSTDPSSFYIARQKMAEEIVKLSK